MPENFCPEHGPYPAEYDSCPYHNGNTQRPVQPRPLSDEDDLPTDLRYGQQAAPRPSAVADEG